MDCFGSDNRREIRDTVAGSRIPINAVGLLIGKIWQDAVTEIGAVPMRTSTPPILHARVFAKILHYLVEP